jgi:hypothetical protein
MIQTGDLRFPVDSSCHYNNQTCVGGFKVTLQDLFRTNSPHGLALTSGYFYGCLRDEEGGLWVYMRNVAAEGSPVIYLYYKAPGKASIIHPEQDQCFKGMIVNRIRGDQIRLHSWRGIAGPGFSGLLDPQGFRLVEEGRIELAGRRFGLGMNVYWPQGGEDVYYNSVFYEAEGTILGKKVKGGIIFDQCYGPPGENWQTLRFFSEVEIAWVGGFTFYEDGEKEGIHAAFGKGDWGWLFATSGDRITALSRFVKGEIELDRDQYPQRVVYKTLEAGDWEWIAEPACQLNKGQNLPLHWVEGCIRRIGEKRGIVRSMGWMEVFPDRI